MGADRFRLGRTSLDRLACVIVIGNEILSGRIRDSNIQFLAVALGRVGIRVKEVRVVADDEAAVIAAVNACRFIYDYVFTTGGIGPTHDDITTACIAKAFGVPLHRHPEALERLTRYYGASLNPARLRMADLPEGATLIDNPISQAPGFRLGNVFVMAGVPRVMQAMFDGVRPGLQGGPAMASRTVTAYVREGDLADGMTAIQTRNPTVEIGSYPFFRNDRLGVSVVTRGYDADAMATASGEIETLMRALGGDPQPVDLAAEDGEP
ncbi:MAG: competence/damage-inducible protein A [Alphaproteobacteria bacterium]|nr:competence/damage-inducible protein A [Alphaproteobacteria bacterium]